MDKKILTKIEKIIKDFFKKAKIEAEIDVSENESEIKVNLDSPDSALLIGYHGETLKSIEHLLRQLVRKNSDEFIRLNLDINGYREKENFKLEEISRKVARRVRNSGRAEELELMDASRRRLVHLAIKGISGVVSESIGEGLQRRVLIRPK